jgi:hypothetical protein
MRLTKSLARQGLELRKLILWGVIGLIMLALAMYVIFIIYKAEATASMLILIFISSLSLTWLLHGIFIMLTGSYKKEGDGL